MSGSMRLAIIRFTRMHRTSAPALPEIYNLLLRKRPLLLRAVGSMLGPAARATLKGMGLSLKKSAESLPATRTCFCRSRKFMN